MNRVLIVAAVVVFAVTAAAFGGASAYADNAYLREIAGEDGVWRLSADQASRVLVPKGSVLEFYVGRFTSRELAREELRAIPVSADSESWLEVPAGYEADILVGSLERPRVIAWEYDVAAGEVVGNGELVIELPPGTGTFAGQGHKTRTLVEGSDGLLYLSIGSNCDHCVDDLERYAGIWRLDTGTGKMEAFARGLRNTVFFVESGTPGVFYGNDMGQDDLGEELPPDELNLLVSGGQYGWPYCYGDRVPVDPADEPVCAETVAPAFAYAAHSAPLGIRRVPEAFSGAWAGDLLVAQHGSVIRADSIAGYKIVRVRLDAEGMPVREDDTIVGFVRGDNIPFGRPVDMIFGPDGTLYVTDDHAGVIHRIRKNPSGL